MQEKYFKLDAREENGLIYIATNDEKIKGYIRQIPGARLVENANTYWTIPVSRTNFLCVAFVDELSAFFSKTSQRMRRSGP